MIDELLEYKSYTYLDKADPQNGLPKIKREGSSISYPGVGRAMLILARHFLFLPDKEGQVLNPKKASSAQVNARVDFAKKAIIAYLSPAHLTPGYQFHNDDLTPQELQDYSDVLVPADPDHKDAGQDGLFYWRAHQIAQDEGSKGKNAPIMSDVVFGIGRWDFVETLSFGDKPVSHYANHCSSTQVFLSMVIAEALRVGPLDPVFYECAFSLNFITRIYNEVLAVKNGSPTAKPQKFDERLGLILLLLEYSVLGVEDYRQCKREHISFDPSEQAPAFFHDFPTQIFVGENSAAPKLIPSVILPGGRAGGNSTLRKIVMKGKQQPTEPLGFAVYSYDRNKVNSEQSKIDSDPSKAELDQYRASAHLIRYDPKAKRLFLHDVGFAGVDVDNRTVAQVRSQLECFFAENSHSSEKKK